jgi:Fis family transcriptional regulator
MNNPSFYIPRSDAENITLSQIVQQALTEYFDHLDGNTPTELHSFVIEQVERPLLTSALTYTDGNQSKTAKILGISRTTLRKKLLQYDLLDSKFKS